MNKERHIYIGIIITLTMTLVMTLVLFTQFNDPTWHDVATTFIFPFIYTIIGAIVVALVGTTIADTGLENYNDPLPRPFKQEDTVNRRPFPNRQATRRHKEVRSYQKHG